MLRIDDLRRYGFNGGGGAALDETKFGQAEIKNFGMAAFGDKNVCGFDVAMDDALRMCCIETIGDFDADVEEQFHVQRPAHDGVLKGPAVEELHGDEGFAGFVPDVINGANVGMV